MHPCRPRPVFLPFPAPRCYNPSTMRAAPLLLLALAVCAAAPAAPAESPYPLWDNNEPVAAYARRVGLEPTKTLDLGNGVKMDFVLIPAGKFLMGTPKPEPVTRR